MAPGPAAAEGSLGKARPRGDPLAERVVSLSNESSAAPANCSKRARDAPDLTLGVSPGPKQPAPLQRTAQEPPAKRPCSAPATRARDEERHAVLQRKLVGGAEQPGDRGAAPRGPVVPQPGAKLTPLEQQVVELKRKHPGVVLVIEVGYKMRFFGEDAETAARVCNIACYPDHNFLTASIPVQRTHVHVRRLVRAGLKVGIVKQTESAALKAAGSNKSGPFVRSLVALHTPATLDAGDVENGGLDSTDKAAASADQDDARGSSNCLLAVLEQESPAAAALVAVDCLSGAVRTATIRESGGSRAELEAALLLVDPVELLLVEPLSGPTQKLLGAWAGRAGTSVERVGRSKATSARAEALAFFSGAAGAVLEMDDLVVEALVLVLSHLRAFGMEKVLAQAACFQPLRNGGRMELSANCLEQLEVLENSDTGAEHGSLLWLLSQTATRGGRRLMRQWASHPLTDRDAIVARQDSVEELISSAGGESGREALQSLPNVLPLLPDLEVGVTRMLHHSASPSEAHRVLCAFSGLPAKLGLLPIDQRRELREKDGGSGTGEAALPKSSLLRELLARATDPAVEEEAIAMLRRLSREAAEQDDLINLLTDAAEYPEVFACHKEVEAADHHLAALLKDIRKVLRRPSLNYTEIQNQGKYLVEVPVDSAVPPDWIKVCGTKKVDRYWPPEVKEGIFKREQAIERRRAVCKVAWGEFLDRFAKHYCAFRAAALAVSNADALLSLAKVSSGPGFCRPDFVEIGKGEEDNNLAQIRIVGGRHPVLDVLLPTGCVANDTRLAAGAGMCSAAMITGPNMGGKSCYIKQTALIVIMAQMGCYVPAESCTLHVVDGIHTRMGASDDLAGGHSTFEVEMKETSAILAKATPRSLVIIDELGRGTSTHDGVAIASATLEHLLVKQRCLVLFVTHYPQLGELLARLPGRAEALYMDYQKTHASEDTSLGASAPRVTFLYKLVPGIVESSFGMNVAAMAGIPQAVISRASGVAASLQARIESNKIPADEQEMRKVLRLVRASLGARDLEKLAEAQKSAA